MRRMRVPRLPTGETLDEPTWRSRHAILLACVGIQLLALVVLGIVRETEAVRLVKLSSPIVVLGAAAALPALRRTTRVVCCVLALLSCSVMLVVLWDGRTEAYFHYFVVVGAVALYEAWLPYLLAFGAVMVQHSILALTAPELLRHGTGGEDALLWAGVYGVFIGGLALANIATWRAGEAARVAQRRSDARFRRVFADAPAGVALLDEAGVIDDVNAAMAASAGTTPAQLTGRSWLALLPPEDRAASTWPPARDGDERELRLLRADGSTGWLLWRFSALQGDEDGRAWIAQAVDVSARKLAEQRLEHQAAHDPLTGLLNRERFTERLRTALDRRRDGATVAVCFADVDDFKRVNDVQGHAAGDELLRTLAGRLHDALRPGDLVGRFGGDEFVVAATVEDEAGARAIADRLTFAFDVPYVIDGEARSTSVSLGVAVAQPDDDAAALIADADQAMYRAKQAGKARCVVFDDAMRDEVHRQAGLARELRRAIAEDELELHWQPQVRLRDERWCGVEALVRWRHPERGLLGPGAFVPFAEEHGLIDELGAWVLRAACKQAAAWPTVQTSVNLSAHQLVDPQLPDTIERALAASALDPSRLCLEITETAVISNRGVANAVIERLHGLGCSLAIDDFGIGHSSLSQLSELSGVDELKIDRSFVARLEEDSGCRAVVGAVVELAHALDMVVVAEGVETAEQARLLRDLGCQRAQGFRYARPVPAAQVLDRLRAVPA